MTILSQSAFGEILGGSVHNPERDFLTLIGNEEQHRLRLGRYRENMKAYKGFHWSANYGADPRSGRGAFSQDSQTGPLVYVNYVKKLADKISNSLFKKAFDIVLGEGDEAVKRQKVKGRLDDVWEWNGRERKATLMGQSGGVWGDVFTRISMDENMRNGEGGTRIDILPPQFCFPDFDPVDQTRMRSCLVIWPTKTGGGDMIRSLADRLVTSGEERVDGEILEAVADIRKSSGNPRSNHGVTIRGEWIFPDVIFDLEGLNIVNKRPNPFKMINVVHWPNYPLVGEPWGVADITDTVELQREWIEKATDISDIIGYHASPVTIVAGADIDELERGPNKVWGLPADASAYNLELSSEMGPSLNYLALIKETMHEMSGVPLGALGGSEGASAEFGVALAMQMAPLLELLAVKAGTYGEGMRRMNELILRSEAVRDKGFRKELNKLPKATRYDSEIMFFPPLPRDEQVQLEIAGTKLELGLSTRERELTELGVRDVTLARDIVADSKKEREADLAMEMGAEGFEVGGGQQGQGANSPKRVVQGEKVSATAEKKRTQEE